LTQANQEWLEKVNLLKTLPGIGQVISTTLVSDLPELGQLTASFLMQWFAKISLGSFLTIHHLVPRDSQLSLIKGCACFGLT
jgi:transposase